jgi:hypothetical protein
MTLCFCGADIPATEERCRVCNRTHAEARAENAAPCERVPPGGFAPPGPFARATDQALSPTLEPRTCDWGIYVV